MDPIIFCKYSNTPWNSKSKFMMLKKMSMNESYQAFLTEKIDDIAWGLANGLEINHLVPHCAVVFRNLKKSIPTFTEVINGYLLDVLLKNDIDIIQINFFKYMASEDNQILFKNILTVLEKRTISSTPKYVFLKTIYHSEGNSFKTNRINEIIDVSLRHQNSSIRLAAFEVSNTDLNFAVVESFLTENVYVEDSSFRNEMSRTYTNFLLRVQESLYRHITKKEESDVYLLSCEHFNWIGLFLINCLVTNSYQRNKFAMNLLEFMFNHYDTIDEDGLRKKGVLEKMFCSNKFNCVKKYLKDIGKWQFEDVKLQEILIEKTKDENSDISLKAGELLVMHLNSPIGGTDFHKLYVDSSEYLLSTTEFYNIEAMVTTLEVAVKCCDVLWCNIHQLLDKYIHFAEIYETDLENNFCQTIMTSNEMYAYLLIFKKFHGILSDEQVDRIFILISKLITLLLSKFYFDGVSEDQLRPVAPSFAEMSNAFSRILNVEDVEETMLSDDEQVLLNRMWLNIKVSCDLVSIIGSKELNSNYREECLKILLNILQMNRHKGVIEAAGNSLAMLTSHLTSNEKYAKIADSFIEPILHASVDENLRSSCTRRTAGLSILFYRMALGDTRKEKPLLKIILKELIKVVKSKDMDFSPTSTPGDLKDSGLVVALHCLKPLIHDTSLWQVTQMHLMTLFQICFENMSTNRNWNIRNATLQLYAALICKVIGQSKDISLEEIDMKYPHLLQYIIKAINEQTNQYTFQILEFLSQTFIIVDRELELQTKISNLKQFVCSHLTSNNYYIRNLAANSFSNLIPLSAAFDELIRIIDDTLAIVNSSNVQVNILHGYILTISHLIVKIKTNGRRLLKDSSLDGINDDINTLLEKIKHLPAFISYPIIKSLPRCTFKSSLIKNDIGSREMASLQYSNITDIDGQIQIILNYEFSNKHPSQFYECEEIILTLTKLFEQNLLHFIHLDIWNKFLRKLFDIYFKCTDDNIKVVTANFILKIVVYNEHVSIPNYKVVSKDGCIQIDSQVIEFLPMLACFYEFGDFGFLNILSTVMKERYQPHCSESCRLDVAKTSVILLRSYKKFKNNRKFLNELVFMNFWLLIDEESIVRETSAIFVSRLQRICFPIDESRHLVEQPYCSIRSLISNCLPAVFNSEEETLFLMNCLITCHTLPTLESKTNPFAQKYLVNKLEDASLLRMLYERFVELLPNIANEKISEYKKYFLQRYLNLQVEINSINCISKLKLYFIKSMKELLV